MTEQFKFRSQKWVGFFASLVFLASCVDVAQAQPQGKVAKIGWFRARPTSSSPASAHDVIRRVLRDFG